MVASHFPDPTAFTSSIEGMLIADMRANGAEDASLRRVSYPGETKIAGNSADVLLIINVGVASRADCRVGTSALDHRCEPGNVTLIPARTPWRASLGTHSDLVVVGMPPARIAVAAGRAARDATIVPRLRGQDGALLSIVREMYSDASLIPASQWHFLVDELADRLVAGEDARTDEPIRGRLPPATIARLNAYIEERLAEPLPIDALADVACRSRSHFPRLFRRTLGMSPHQYVLRLRLRRARRLVDRGCPPAEAALAVGFSHQSHLTNWMRHLYGTTPGALPNRRKSAEICNKDRAAPV